MSRGAMVFFPLGYVLPCSRQKEGTCLWNGTVVFMGDGCSIGWCRRLARECGVMPFHHTMAVLPAGVHLMFVFTFI